MDRGVYSKRKSLSALWRKIDKSLRINSPVEPIKFSEKCLSLLKPDPHNNVEVIIKSTSWNFQTLWMWCKKFKEN